MNQQDSSTIGRTHIGFATLEEYEETRRKLKRHQKRLYEKADKAFKEIETERLHSRSN